MGLAAAALASLGLAQDSVTIADRRADLAFLVEKIRELHPDPYWRHGRTTWRREIASLGYRLDALSDAEFLVELKRLVALLRDGHSALTSGQAVSRLPLQFRWFAEGLVVTAAAREHVSLVGLRVVEVDGRGLVDVERALQPAISADNTEDARRRIASALRDVAMLHAVGVADRPDAVMLGLTDLDGSKPRNVRLATVSAESTDALTTGEAVGGTPELARDRFPDRAWFAATLHDDTAYIRFRRVREAGAGAFAAFCKKTFASIESSAEIERLVVDLRGNGGGSNYILQPLIHGLIGCRLNRPGALFVVTDGRTFSAAMNCATRIERETWALFVGARTGARPNHFGDAKTVALPHSGHRLRCSTVRWWDSDPRDERRWIEPDLPVPERLRDERAGRDAALAAIAAYEHRAIEGFDDRQPVAHWFRKSQRVAWPPQQLTKPLIPPPSDTAPPPGRERYMGREIAQTMHWLGAEWLMRKTREDEEHTTRLLDALALEPALTVCDLGCGNGYHSLRIAERLGPHGIVFAADIQKQMLTMLARRQEKLGLDNIERILNTLDDPRLPPRSCDLVLMVDVYHELSHPERILAGLRRALKPGGRLVLVEFRAEDPEVPIKKLHKMSKAQVLKELTANGFRLHSQFDELPWQHMLSFVAARR